MYTHTHTIGYCLLINSKKGTTIFIILRFFSLASSVYRSPAPFEKKKEAPLAAAGSGEESQKKRATTGIKCEACEKKKLNR
jgi:hypothetical protein